MKFTLVLSVIFVFVMLALICSGLSYGVGEMLNFDIAFSKYLVVFGSIFFFPCGIAIVAILFGKEE